LQSTRNQCSETRQYTSTRTCCEPRCSDRFGNRCATGTRGRTQMTMAALRLLPDLEEALRQIPGIKAASVVTGPDAMPTEVHVLATTDKSPKQVVRDVQSLAMARYDLDIDHRIVSVVQFDEPGDSDSHDDTTV